MPKNSLPMAGGCGCNDEEAAACGCRDEAEQRGLEMLKKMSESKKTESKTDTRTGADGTKPGPASADAEGC